MQTRTSVRGEWRGRGRESGRTFEAADVARPLDDGHLEAEADSKERDFLLARPLDREHHALRPAHAEPARDKDPATRTSASHVRVCIDSTDPAETTARHASWYFAGFVVCVSGSRSEESTHWRTLASVWTEILHGSYLQDEPAVTPKCGVLERFGDRHVRVVQVGVLPNEHDRHVVDDPFLPNHGVTIGRPIQLLVPYRFVSSLQRDSKSVPLSFISCVRVSAPRLRRFRK